MTKYQEPTEEQSTGRDAQSVGSQAIIASDNSETMSQTRATSPIFGALRPTESSTRRTIPLDGLWQFVTDRADNGIEHGYGCQLPAQERVLIAVPASWNEQLPELDHFLGPAWYERTFSPPLGFDHTTSSCFLRFGSVNYQATVFVNGAQAGTHEGGHLPFEIDATPHLSKTSHENRLVVRVDGRLERSHVPPGGGWGAMAPGCFPSSSFDFYPFCGIQRTVQMCVRPTDGLLGLNIKVGLQNPRGSTADSATVTCAVRVAAGSSAGRVTACLIDEHAQSTDHGARQWIDLVQVDADGHATACIDIPTPRLWAPGSPSLYKLRIDCFAAHDASLSAKESPPPLDSYEQRVGLREVEVVGNEMRLNGASISLKGFGRHEDFALVGRGDCGAVLVRDHACLQWVGANSYRTACVPFSSNPSSLLNAPLAEPALPCLALPCLGLPCLGTCVMPLSLH